MRANGYDDQFAKQIYQQILGFGEYGFPESHAASFALLVYVSSWLKCYEPAAFTCALLNSQPMGFYSPSQLTQDLRRHGGTILPADACRSDWECTLETIGEASALPPDDGKGTDTRSRAPPPALRLGLCLVKGLSEAGGKRIAAARGSRPFDDVADLVRRAALNRHDIEALAA